MRSRDTCPLPPKAASRATTGADMDPLDGMSRCQEVAMLPTTSQGAVSPTHPPAQAAASCRSLLARCVHPLGKLV